MDSLIHSKRDLIKLKNGYFKFQLSGRLPDVADKGTRTTKQAHTFSWNLPPLNEMGFSDHYNQALIRIRKAEMSNRHLDVYNNIIVVAGTNAQELEGVYLETNITSNNQTIIHNEDNIFVPNATYQHTKVSQKLERKKIGNLYYNGTLDGIVANYMWGADDIWLLGNVEGYNTYNADNAEGGAGDIKSNTSQSRYAWVADNGSTSIFEDGVLCGVPFGREFTCVAVNGFDGDPVALGEAPNNSVQANNTEIYLELEIQLLPNP